MIQKGLPVLSPSPYILGLCTCLYVEKLTGLMVFQLRDKSNHTELNKQLRQENLTHWGNVSSFSFFLFFFAFLNNSFSLCTIINSKINRIIRKKNKMYSKYCIKFAKHHLSGIFLSVSRILNNSPCGPQKG